MIKFKPMATGFHSHTDLGSLDGGSTVMDKAKRAKELGRVADCVTDHGTMAALASHWASCKKCGIRSIHGIEAYLQNPFTPTIKDRHGNDVINYDHLTIHFKTAKAFQHFSSLTPKMEERAVVKYGERKQIMLLEEVQEIASDITIGSGCLVGVIQKYILNGKVEEAQKAYDMYRSIVPKGQFFVEVFPHIITEDWVRPVISRETKQIVTPGYFKPNECGADGLPLDIQKAANKFVIEMAKKYGDPILISEDSHVASPEDKIVQDIRIGNGQDGWKFSNNYCMRSTDEWAANLKSQLGVSDRDIEEMVDNSYLFVDQFKDYEFLTSKDRLLLPTTDQIYEVKGSSNLQLAHEKIDFYDRMPKPWDAKYEEYKERLDKEIAVLYGNGQIDLLPYFFVLEDVCSFCRKEGILFNARGSAGGSLLLYLLGCSITDPIKYGLQFERFLTLGRIKSGSLPDIDMDFSDRDRVLAYLSEKYGDRMALISIQKPLKVKGSIKDIERVKYGQVRQATEAMTKLIPTIPQGISEDKWLLGYRDESTDEYVAGYIEDEKDPGAILLRRYREENPDIWDTLLKCLGVMREKSVHACGLIISSEPVASAIPLLKISGDLCTAYGPKDVEAVGGIKFDFLRVTTLKAIEITLKSIKEYTGNDIEWTEFEHDPEVYSKIIAGKLLTAIFQLNTKTVRPYVAKTLPKSVDEISNLTALIRPGCLDADSPDPSDRNKSAVDYYIDCVTNTRKPYYIHPDLEPIFSESFGVPLFQEQTLHAFRVVGNMDFEQAEVARRAIGKKDRESLMAELKKVYLGAKALEWSDSQAQALCDMIEASARYSFNKSHSTSYGIVAYNGCYLKLHYPLHFWRGQLTAHADEQDKIKEYLGECKHYLLPVSIIKSHPTEWTIESTPDGDRLRAPLSTIKGVAGSGVHIKKFLETDLNTLPKKQKRTPAKRKPKKDNESILGDLTL
jgi:DNA polymerase-3 subunit alpha